MIPASSDGDKAAIWLRDIALAIAVVSPGDNGAILLKSERMIHAYSYGDKVAIGRRDIALAIAVVSPGDDGAILL